MSYRNDDDPYSRRTIGTTYEYDDGSSESRNVTRKAPAPPEPHRPAGTVIEQGYAVPEGIKLTRTPRTGSEMREKFITHLADSYAKGYMTKEEHDARLALAAKVETDAELRILTADLPNLPAPKVEQEKLTFKKFKKDFGNSVSEFWNSGVKAFTTYALFVLSFSAGLTLAILPAVALVGGVKHPTALASGISVCTVVAGIIWTVANIIALVSYMEGK